MKRITPLVAAMFITALAALAVAGTPGEPAPGCTDVAGQMTLRALNLSDRRVLATMDGDIEALRSIRILDVDYLFTPIGLVTSVRGRGLIVTEHGSMVTRDRIFLKKVKPDQPQRAWHGVHRIVFGTGEYAGATGLIKSEGIIGPGARIVNYTGEICVPAATP